MMATHQSWNNSIVVRSERLCIDPLPQPQQNTGATNDSNGNTCRRDRVYLVRVIYGGRRGYQRRCIRRSHISVAGFDHEALTLGPGWAYIDCKVEKYDGVSTQKKCFLQRLGPSVILGQCSVLSKPVGLAEDWLSREKSVVREEKAKVELREFVGLKCS